MTSPKGELVLSAGGQEYRLRLTMSAIGEVQRKHGDDFATKLEAPKDAPEGWLPPLYIVVDVVIEALQRHHKGAGRDLADDLLSEHPDLFTQLMAASFPDQSDAGNGQGTKAAA